MNYTFNVFLLQCYTQNKNILLSRTHNKVLLKDSATYFKNICL